MPHPVRRPAPRPSWNLPGITRRPRRRGPVLASLVSLLAAACTTSPPSHRDGAADNRRPGADSADSPAASEAGESGGVGGGDLARDVAASDTWAGSCDPVAQDCLPGQRCDFTCEGGARFICFDGEGAVGIDGICGPMRGWCGKGLTCVATSSTLGICKKFCNQDSDCPAGKHCGTLGLVCSMGGAAMGFMCEKL